MCGWATRITMGEVAATNRRARFPAPQRSGVLRIASAAATSLAPLQFHRRTGDARLIGSPRPRTRVTREAVKRGRSVTAALGTGDPARVAEDDAETGRTFPRDVRGSKNEYARRRWPVSQRLRRNSPARQPIAIVRRSRLLRWQPIASRLAAARVHLEVGVALQGSHRNQRRFPVHAEALFGAAVGAH